MLKRLFTKPVRLDIGAGTLELRSARELDLALSGRTGLSPIRIATLGALPDEALVREQNALQAMEQSIVGTLARAGENGALDRFLRDLDLSLVPDDNDWRSVLAAIRGLDTTHDDYKKAALLKYVAYLTAGKEFVRAIRSNREGAGAGVDARDAGSGDPGLRQRLVFDLDILLGSDPLQQEVPDEFSRMPKGEVLAVDLLAHQALGVILGKNRFTLVAGSPYLLVDDNGNDYRLRPREEHHRTQPAMRRGGRHRLPSGFATASDRGDNRWWPEPDHRHLHYRHLRAARLHRQSPALT